ncbi:MAG: DUF6098 family protein [Actinomycetes bacterium]
MATPSETTDAVDVLAAHGELPVLGTVGEIAELLRAVGPVYLRYSSGPEADAAEQSRDHESGCALPGLSVNPLRPEPWWDRPAEEWVARQLCQYLHLHGDDRRAWLLTGTEVGRGPDCEPLLADVTTLAVLDDRCLTEAQAIYATRFDAGRTS